MNDDGRPLARIEALVSQFHAAADSTEPPDTTTHRQHDAIVRLLGLGVPAEEVGERLRVSTAVIEGLSKAEDPNGSDQAS